MNQLLNHGIDLFAINSRFKNDSPRTTTPFLASDVFRIGLKRKRLRFLKAVTMKSVLKVT